MHALEQQLRRFDRDGFVTIDGALSPAEVRRLTRLTERLRRSEPVAADGSLHALGFVAREPAFVELVDHPRVLELVCAILGWNIHMYHCHLDVHPPAAADPAEGVAEEQRAAGEARRVVASGMPDPSVEHHGRAGAREHVDRARGRRRR